MSCRFCLGNGLLDDAPIATTALFYVLASRDPDLPGAAMVIPHRHIETPFELLPAEWQDLGQALARARTHLLGFQPAGYTIGWNVGAAAGQTIPHAHLHVIARHGTGHGAGEGLRAALKAVRCIGPNGN